MRGLRTVEAAVLDHGDAVIVGESIEHGCTHTAAGGSAGHDQTVAAEKHEIRLQRRAEEAARLLLLHHDILRCGRDVRHDRVAVQIVGLPHRGVFARTAVDPEPASPVPQVGPGRSRGIDHRHAFCARGVDQSLDHLDRGPRIFAAGIAPALDRVEDRLGPVAAEKVIHVDHHERRPFAKALQRAIAGGGEYLFVSVGEKTVPYALCHCSVSECVGGAW